MYNHPQQLASSKTQNKAQPNSKQQSSTRTIEEKQSKSQSSSISPAVL
jgi:hypothetical protein